MVPCYRHPVYASDVGRYLIVKTCVMRACHDFHTNSIIADFAKY